MGSLKRKIQDPGDSDVWGTNLLEKLWLTALVAASHRKLNKNATRHEVEGGKLDRMKSASSLARSNY